MCISPSSLTRTLNRSQKLSQDLEPRSPDSDYNDQPSPMFDRTSATTPLAPRNGGSAARAPADRRQPSDGAVSVARRKMSEDASAGGRASLRSRVSEEDPYGGVDEGSRSPPQARRKPSEDMRRRQPSDDFRAGDRRRPSEDMRQRDPPRSRSRDRDLVSEAGSAVSGAAATALREEVVPVKSTIAEEDVALPPFARGGDADADALYDDGSDEEALSPRTPRVGGLSALSSRLGEEPRRPSVDTGGRQDGDLLAKIEGLERQVEDAEAERAAAVDQAEERVRQLDAELNALRQASTCRWSCIARC
jgi:hypothetical protein